jgi:CHASE1-domain containing sensor protein
LKLSYRPLPTINKTSEFTLLLRLIVVVVVIVVIVVVVAAAAAADHKSSGKSIVPHSFKG